MDGPTVPIAPSDTADRGLVRSAFALVGLTAFLLVFGSTVRVHGAGLACPDWPLCFGEVVPAFDVKVYLEFGHRVVAGVVSLWFVAQSWILWKRGMLTASRLLRILVPAAAVVLAAQVVLGGLTVLELLAEWTVASHLVTGNTFAALLLLTALALRDRAAETPAAVGGASRALATLLLVLVPSQLVLGGLVAGSNAGLVCGTWPSCNGAGWFPTFSGLVGLQVTHRLVAYTLLGVALANVAVQWRRPALRTPAIALLGLVLLQAIIGITNVLMQLPVEITLAHSAGAAAIYLTTTWQAYEAWRAPLVEATPAAASAPSTRTVEAA